MKGDTRSQTMGHFTPTITKMDYPNGLLTYSTIHVSNFMDCSSLPRYLISSRIPTGPEPVLFLVLGSPHDGLKFLVEVGHGELGTHGTPLGEIVLGGGS